MKNNNSSVKEKYIALDPKIYSFINEENIYYNSSLNSVEKIPRHLALFLNYCTEFKTIEEHTEFIYNKISKTINLSEITDCINFFIKKKFILSQREIIKRLKSNKTKVDNSRIKYLGWITNGRLPELQLSIESFIKYNRIYKKELSVIVCDDSINNTNILKQLFRITTENRINVFYFGNKEKNNFIEKLSKDLNKYGVEKKILDFLILNPLKHNTCGANRNSLLLVTAGNKILSVDDDILFETFSSQKQNNNLEFSSEREPLDIEYFTDRNELLKKILPCDTDVFLQHENILGKSINEIILKFKDTELFLDKANNGFIYSIIKNDRKIPVTMPGIAGSSGKGSPKSVLWINGLEREKIMKSKIVYKTYICRNEVFRLPDNLKISNGSFLMGYNMGIDNREMIPPFLPIGRGSDTIFASLLKMTNSYICYLPFSLYHDPLKRRLFNYKDIFNFSLHISDLILLIIESIKISTHYSDVPFKLIMIGNYFKDISKLNKIDFFELIQNELIKHKCSFIKFLESLLIKYDSKPEFWAEDIFKIIKIIEKNFKNKDMYFPVELNNNDSIENKEKELKKTFNLFGELLISWPLIYLKAKEFNEQGIDFFNKI